MKSDTAGNMIWMKEYDLDDPFSIKSLPNGNIIIAASYFDGTNYKAVAVETNDSGVPLISKSYAGSVEGSGADLRMGAEGNFIFVIQNDDGVNLTTTVVSTDSSFKTGCETSNNLPLYLPVSFSATSVNFQSANLFQVSTIQPLVFSQTTITNECQIATVPDNLNHSSLIIYPTVSSGLFNISSDENILLHIFNSTGKEIRKVECRNSSSAFDLTEFPAGIYFYNAEMQWGRGSAGKIVLIK
jgi:hypothetical protein